MHERVPFALTEYTFLSWNVGVLPGPFVAGWKVVTGSANGVNQSSFPVVSFSAQTPSFPSRVPIPYTRPSATDGVPHPLPYDYLVLATGVHHSYFGHDEYAAYAPGLKTLTDAVQLRNKILGTFEACERTPVPQDHPELLTFVIVGGGPTGVELAGAIAELRSRFGN